MDSFDQQRRSLLVTFAGVGISPLLPQLIAAAQPGVQRGYGLGSAEGEQCLQRLGTAKMSLGVAP